MLQADDATDYVLATGVGTTVRDFADAAFSRLGLAWQDHVKHDESFERPAEVDALIGDASQARAQLGWTPRTNAVELANLMVDSDLEEINRFLRS
jgi:GDPmannose 4,6-dehydratase